MPTQVILRPSAMPDSGGSSPRIAWVGCQHEGVRSMYRAQAFLGVSEVIKLQFHNCWWPCCRPDVY